MGFATSWDTWLDVPHKGLGPFSEAAEVPLDFSLCSASKDLRDFSSAELQQFRGARGKPDTGPQAALAGVGGVLQICHCVAGAGER